MAEEIPPILTGPQTRREFLTNARNLALLPVANKLAKLFPTSVEGFETVLSATKEVVADHDPLSTGECSAVKLSDGRVIACQKRGPQIPADAKDPSHDTADTVAVYVKNGTWSQPIDLKQIVPGLESQRLTDPVFVKRGDKVGLILMSYQLADGMEFPAEHGKNSGLIFIDNVETGDPARMTAINISIPAADLLHQSEKNNYVLPDFPQVAVHPDNPDLIAVTYHLMGGERLWTGIQTSVDGGKTWSSGEKMSGLNGEAITSGETPKPFFFSDGSLGVSYENYADHTFYIAKMNDKGLFDSIPVVSRKEKHIVNQRLVNVLERDMEISLDSKVKTKLPAGSLLTIDLPEEGLNAFQPTLYVSIDEGKTYETLGIIRSQGEMMGSPIFITVDGYGPVVAYYKFNPETKNVKYSYFDLQTGDQKDLTDGEVWDITPAQFSVTGAPPVKRVIGDYNYGGAFVEHHQDNTSSLCFANLERKKMKKMPVE